MSSERKMAPRRFASCQGSGAGFRRATRAINGPLTSFLRVITRPKLTSPADSFIGRRGVSGVESTSLKGKAPVQATGAIFKRVLKGVANGN